MKREQQRIMMQNASIVSRAHQHMPFEDGAFDAALCIGVLSYLQSDKNGIAG
jgi:hypothetical protein